MYLDIRYYDDFDIAMEEIRKTISTGEFQSLVEDAFDRRIPEELKRWYLLLKENKPEEIGRYLISEQIETGKTQKIRDEIEFVHPLSIQRIGDEILAMPESSEDESFVITLDDKTAEALQIIIDTKSIGKTLEALYKIYPDEKREDVEENLLDLIHKFKCQNIIRP